MINLSIYHFVFRHNFGEYKYNGYDLHNKFLNLAVKVQKHKVQCCWEMGTNHLFEDQKWEKALQSWDVLSTDDECKRPKPAAVRRRHSFSGTPGASQDTKHLLRGGSRSMSDLRQTKPNAHSRHPNLNGKLPPIDIQDHPIGNGVFDETPVPKFRSVPRDLVIHQPKPRQDYKKNIADLTKIASERHDYQ